MKLERKAGDFTEPSVRAGLLREPSCLWSPCRKKSCIVLKPSRRSVTGRLSVVQAAELLHLSRSQVHRLLQAYDQDGAGGLASKKRGRPSNRRHDEEFRNTTLNLVRHRYRDFGPTLASEKLLEWHQIAVSTETLRKWMTEAGI